MTYPFLSVVKQDSQAVDDLIRVNLNSEVPMVEEIAAYLIEAGGKRLRPLLVLLCAKACGYQGSDHVKLAAVIEFLHTAMLLHDDVVDESDLRRGRETVNAAWGNAPSVLVGDFLHSRAFEMMVDIGNIRVMEILSRATNVIAEGEVQQLSFIRNPATTEVEYMEIISRKTAMLFQAAAHAGAVLAGANEKTEHALRDYGLHLGIAFQMVDDQLDYLGTPEELGKNIGDDLAEGKVTLPLIVAMRNGQPDQKAFVEDAIRNGGVENLPEMIQLVKATDALKYTSEQANTERCEALACLNNVADSEFKDSMNTLVNFVVDRHH
ncbi:MAG: octaprenyl diphosphate synthase [Gammaproteobacteria bacterium]|jgi:octaprenyl-diphosphate synthase|nr:octaprenyl diphosphate synthase [Gammaproteobacteria bacterium]MBT3866293.1 octaprenyl diphosphate synthase [Gammaproteobacteria bacterium]MBT4380111.1 octaprenyl diphosphate synthase [Gammaproteobacteria bacterium]MBT4619307.1 octaprenyl diphosphate synthase [Gammaproteobacteria bacterium]MBT6571774.1 octaprenyl diphosphate synthase [Gammaproteobacteria bacterium]